MQPKAEKEKKDPPTRGELQAKCEGIINGIDLRVGYMQDEMREVKSRCDALLSLFSGALTDEERETLATIKEAIEEIESEHGETLSSIRNLALELQAAIKRRGIRNTV